MVLSDGMVHFLKIKKKLNKSTKTIIVALRASFKIPIEGISRFSRELQVEELKYFSIKQRQVLKKLHIITLKLLTLYDGFSRNQT